MRWALVTCAMLLGCAPETVPASVPALSRTAAASVPVTRELVNETPGRLGQGQVRRVVRAHEGDLLACYEPEVRADPTLQGRIDVSWEILPDGEVSAPMLARSTLGNSRVEECVLRTVRGWRFPASESQTTVESFPLRFPM